MNYAAKVGIIFDIRKYMDKNLIDLVNLGDFHYRLLQDGRFHCVNQDTELLPCELCNLFGTSIPDYAEYVRAKNYDLMVGIIIRVMGPNALSISLNKIEP